jgi:hypothetical protein
MIRSFLDPTLPGCPTVDPAKSFSSPGLAGRAIEAASAALERCRLEGLREAGCRCLDDIPDRGLHVGVR